MKQSIKFNELTNKQKIGAVSALKQSFEKIYQKQTKHELIWIGILNEMNPDMVLDDEITVPSLDENGAAIISDLLQKVIIPEAQKTFRPANLFVCSAHDFAYFNDKLAIRIYNDLSHLHDAEGRFPNLVIISTEVLKVLKHFTIKFPDKKAQAFYERFKKSLVPAEHLFFAFEVPAEWIEGNLKACKEILQLINDGKTWDEALEEVLGDEQKNTQADDDNKNFSLSP